MELTQPLDDKIIMEKFKRQAHEFLLMAENLYKEKYPDKYQEYLEGRFDLRDVLFNLPLLKEDGTYKIIFGSIRMFENGQCFSKSSI